MPHRILIVDDEPEALTAFGRALQHDGYEVESALDGEQALRLLEPGDLDLLIIDVGLPRVNGLGVVARMRERNLETPTIAISGGGTIDTAVQAVKLGAFDFVQKPIERERLLLSVRNALRFNRLREAHERLQQDVVGAELLGVGASMERLKTLVAKVARSDGRILITGENGTGKELVAAAIHAGSARAKGPFVKLNCGAVPKDLVESELFGHEKGAFTGAFAARKGRFELADGGTLLLDEVGDMPMPMQVKLLRVLQESAFERVGASRSIEVDVRVLAATNRDLGAMVQDGSFREDLYYRLNVLTLHVPPLRERREDIPTLLSYFTRKHSAHDLRFAPDAVAALQRHSYPGNVRELQNLVERLAILYPGETIDAECVREILSMSNGGQRASRGQIYEFGRSMRDLLQEVERQIMVEAIAAHGSSKTAAAAALGAERSHFYKKCRQYGITGGEL
jgi:DNA-binding NtrC family response regulator